MWLKIQVVRADVARIVSLDYGLINKMLVGGIVCCQEVPDQKA